MSMQRPAGRPQSPSGKRRPLKSGLLIAAVVLCVPLVVFIYQARQSGLPIGQLFEHVFNAARPSAAGEGSPKSRRGRKIDFLTPVPIGFPSSSPPRIGSLEIVDLDRDSLPDILVADMLAQRIGWIRQSPPGVFAEQWIGAELPAPAHVSAFDIDQDGDLDVLVACMGLLFPSNDRIGSVVIPENDGRGTFNSHLIWGSTNEDYGSSGIRLVDLNRDGKLDVLLTNGDAFDYLPPRPRPWHSVQWLENRGTFSFEHRSIARYMGASGAVAADLDGDGDLDVAAVTCYNFWERPDAQSISWFENDGNMNFTERDISAVPTHLISLESGDMNRDGKPDLVTVRMNVYQPFSNDGRVVLWLNNWGRAGRQTP